MQCLSKDAQRLDEHPSVSASSKIELKFRRIFCFSQTLFTEVTRSQLEVTSALGRHALLMNKQQDYAQLMREYYQILSDILPLNSQTEEVTEDMAESRYTLNI